ncbi:GOLPH3/VPS74 family protein [Streptomyces sp. 1331.2]|uniref:GOLPH3/VPS74 family protein n=1 Tax=Streptomyces sp. 1331.2 TaxID=1938835 RepID=UPI000BC66857|nr:GPP34 family phosphoprotein [Streptomyces sp. 1331.2]SOB86225.1 Golgi phosphoprotein 3 (GPP34) [Streptomyces sp. 1331.2]
MHVTLAEELMLLSLDDESGVAKDGSSAGWAVAGSFLADLAMAGRIAVEEGRLAVTDPTPTGDPLLDERLERLVEWIGRKAPGKAKASEWLTRDHATAVRATVLRLCQRGLVVEERHRLLGLFPVRRYPEADGSVERELRERLASVIRHHAAPDVRTATLIALLHAARLHGLAFPDLPRKRVEMRFAEIAAGDWAGDSVGQAIRNMHVAIAAIAAVTAATAATAAVS